MLKKKIFTDPCRMMRAIRFATTLPGFTLDQDILNYFQLKGRKDLMNYKRNKRVCMDAMSMVSNDDHFLDAINIFMANGLVPGLLDGMILKSDEELASKKF